MTLSPSTNETAFAAAAAAAGIIRHCRMHHTLYYTNASVLSLLFFRWRWAISGHDKYKYTPFS